jgi:transcriptional regulator with XRE-family HTH domain
MISNLGNLDDAFGKILQLRRLRRGFSQERLAIEANLTRTYISQLEYGIKNPSLLTIVKISNALNVKPSVFIDHVEHYL